MANAHVSDGEEKPMSISRPVALLGRARVLIYGPLRRLPGGRWQARVVFKVSENISGNQLKVDLVSGDIVFQGACALPPDGRFEFSFNFEVRDRATLLNCDFTARVPRSKVSSIF